ncbi:hypothetical protein [Rhodohalobacter sp.]|uniref:hypothetical protein n=1 Tax=Rhodohalobacter sp. TaxID=1974210 RepID=UPI002ACDE159|nr:hypothetical protein [Rhodohalobacter sp.]MDZ7756758.1 hypothetical protein [Rhodohalobacter sp.]
MRICEIQKSWCIIHSPRYIILDDVDDGLTPFGDRFIRCDPKTGFADKEKVKRVVGLV